jgi:hypothetical protein
MATPCCTENIQLKHQIVNLNGAALRFSDLLEP